MAKFTTEEQLINAAQSTTIIRLGYSMLLETAAAELRAFKKINDVEAKGGLGSTQERVRMFSGMDASTTPRAA